MWVLELGQSLHMPITAADVEWWDCEIFSFVVVSYPHESTESSRLKLNSVFLSLQVYEQSISAVCQIDWPRDRMLVQVLDDSDDQDTRMLIKAEVQKWNTKGVNILYRHRVVRTGYKAGNLKSAMNCEYVQDYEFVTIFDADFQPKSDFLKKTIPHFKVRK